MGTTRYRVKGSKGTTRRGGSRSRKPRWRLAAWLLGIAFFAGALGLAAAAIAVQVVESGLPPVPTWAEYAARVPKVSRVLAADGTVVAEFFTERRTLLRPDAIPPVLQNALLAAEDADFFHHEGLSYWGIARAAVVNFWRGHVSQGGSTLTQQVVKQVLLSPERTVERKVRELLLARLVEKKLTKQEILAIYLTEVYLGHGRYGFEEAARFYFGKTAAELEVPEAALLAGLVSAPESNSPLRNPAGAIARQHYVLGRMQDLGMLTPAAARAAATAEMTLVGRAPPRAGAAPYFVDAVRREVTRILGEGRLLHDGLTVRTTLDLGASDAAETAVLHGLARLWGQGRTRDADEARALQAGIIADGTDDLDEIPPPPKAVRARVVASRPDRGVLDVSVAGRHAGLDPASLGRRLLAGKPDLFGDLREGDEVPVSLANGEADLDGETLRRVNAEIGPQADLVVIDPHTRAVVALVGGEDHGARPFNRAVQSRRPIGSTVKPFLYAAALAGGLDPTSTFPNTALSFHGAGGRAWTPRNYEGGYDGRDYGLAEALAKSINVIAVRVMAAIGAAPVADLLAAVGIPGAPRDLSLALGSAEASPLALANAFSTFAAGGMYDTPFFLHSVTDADGNVLLEHHARPSRVLPEHVATALRAMMRQAVLTGTAQAAASLAVPAWGKTGTTNRSREAWFAGFDGHHVAVVQVAYDDRLPMHGATGGNTAVPIFVDFVRMLVEMP